MVCYLILCRLRPEFPPEKVEELMRRTRMSLLKIDAALSVRCGHTATPGSQWEFFLALESHSIERMAAARDHPVFVKYMEEVLKPHTAERLELDYEMDPARIAVVA